MTQPDPAAIASRVIDYLTNPDAIRGVVDVIDAHPDYRVLRRFKARDHYGNPEMDTDVRTGLFVDVETTGLDPETDNIIQLAIVPFVFDRVPDGAERILSVGQGMAWLEDPGQHVPEEATAIHGIRNQDLVGERIDDAAVAALVADAALIVAHYAEFDRPKIEARFPSLPFATLPWACSYREVDWVQRYGAVAGKLGAALAAFGEFTDSAHDALNDCRVGIHVLASSIECETCTGAGLVRSPVSMDPGEGEPCPDCADGRRYPFVDLLHSARRWDYRIRVFNSPFAVKDRLKKGRKYRWDGDSDNKDDRHWYKDVKSTEFNTEIDWLKANVPTARVTYNRYGARDRYSVRV